MAISGSHIVGRFSTCVAIERACALTVTLCKIIELMVDGVFFQRK